MKRALSLLVLVLAAACSRATTPGASTTTPVSPVPSVSPSTEAPVAAENNPPGDIPDTQAFFVAHTSGGFDVKIPEGWARTTTSNGETFGDKLNSIIMEWSATTDAPSAARAQNKDVPNLKRAQRAFELRTISSVALPAGTVIVIAYRANSVPNDVTGKQYRLDVLRYEFYRNGHEADISLSSPVGADNVDPWNTVTRSFSWR